MALMSLIRIAAFCRRLRDDHRGMAAVSSAMVAVPVAVGVGVAMDGGRAYLVQAQLGHALDIAALAGARTGGSSAVGPEATRLFEANFPASYLGAARGTVTTVTDPNTGRVTVSASTEVPTTMMRLMGVKSIPVRKRAVAHREQMPMELALVLDVTGSMQGSKLTALKQAAGELLDSIYGPRDVAEGLYVSVVPFAARVNIGTTRTSWLRSTTSGWKGCVENRTANPLNDETPAVEKWTPTAKQYSYSAGWTTVTGSIPCPKEILPLTASKQTITTKINGLSAEGSTRIDMGAQWGWRVLSPKWKGLWGDTLLPQPASDKLLKAVILMTDGKNEPSAYYDTETAAQADKNLATLCTQMKKAGIVIYTIGFQTPSSAKPMLEACASVPPNYFESPTNESLRTAFRVIGGRLSKLRLME